MSRRAQLVRTFALFRLLARPDGASLAELESELGVSKRTLQRDLQAIEDSGFPILEHGDGWPPRRRVSAEVIRAAGLCIRLDELLALRLAQGELLSLGSAELAAAMDSLLAKLRPLCSKTALAQMSKVDGIGARRPRMRALPQQSQAFAVLVQGMLESRCVRIDYSSRSQRGRAWREVEPYDVAPRGSGFYLVGPSVGTAEVRNFLISRIQRAELTDRTFTRPVSFSVERHFGDAFGVHQGPPMDVRIVFEAEAAAYVRERTWHRTQRIEDHPDGTLELSFRAGGLKEVKSWVQSFGASATVLAPTSLAEDLLRDARVVLGRAQARRAVAAETSPAPAALARKVGRRTSR